MISFASCINMVLTFKVHVPLKLCFMPTEAGELWEHLKLKRSMLLCMFSMLRFIYTLRKQCVNPHFPKLVFYPGIAKQLKDLFTIF